MLLASGRRSFPDLHAQSRRIFLFSVELCQDGNGEFKLWDLCFITTIPFPQECHCPGQVLEREHPVMEKGCNRSFLYHSPHLMVCAAQR